MCAVIINTTFSRRKKRHQLVLSPDPTRVRKIINSCLLPDRKQSKAISGLKPSFFFFIYQTHIDHLNRDIMASPKSSKPTSAVVETPSSSSSKSSWVYPATVVLPLLAFAFFKLQSNPSLLGGLASSEKLHEQPRSSPSSVASSAEDTFETMRRQYGAACPEHNYQTHIFSTDPLIIYVENYLSYEETRYILNLA